MFINGTLFFAAAHPTGVSPASGGHDRSHTQMRLAHRLAWGSPSTTENARGLYGKLGSMALIFAYAGLRSARLPSIGWHAVVDHAC